MSLQLSQLEEIAIKGYIHIHSAIQLDQDCYVYIAVDHNDDCCILKYFQGKVVSKIIIEEIPLKMYTFLDTVVLLYGSNERFGSLYIVNFNKKDIQPLITNIDNTSKFNHVFVSNNRILFKTYSENTQGNWSLYENGCISNFNKEGECVGFIDDTIVFYRKISDIIIYSDLASLYEFGMIEKYYPDTGKVKFMSFSILPSMVVENFIILDDNEHAIAYSYNEKSGGQKHTIINLRTGAKKELKLIDGYWQINLIK